jgi:drug/metabolite transporter (DMT)-like permease
VVSGWQHLAGGVGFVLIALLAAEPSPTPTAPAWAAWAYLVVFGSMIAFTAFVVALKHLPTGVVMTYAYVNPVIAVILGRLILSEPVTPATVAGTALIVAGVWGVFRDKRPTS